MDKKEELIKEAIKRGYVEGVATFDLYYAKPKQVTLPKFKGWDYSSGCLWYDVDGGSNNSIVVFDRDDGWAEIIKPEIKKEPMTIEQLEKQKAEIEKQIEALKQPPIEFGKWYYAEFYEEQKWLIKLSKKRDGENNHYISNEFIDLKSSNRIRYSKGDVDFFSFSKDDGCDLYRLATKDEIKNVLINEAIARGFKEGVPYKTVHGKIYTAKGSFQLNWMGRDNLYFTLSDGLIYENGKWGEVVKEEPIKIGSYDVKWEDDTLHVGCKRININEVKSLEKLMHALATNEITLLGEKITLTLLEKILNLKHK